ncbi:MAG: hypothetical protein GF384_06285 [Elusimicrobia bacterium]|nr:hypothetical protein [Elusimicrobiota bacterium]
MKTRSSGTQQRIADIKTIRHQLYAAVLDGIQEGIYALIDAGRANNIEPIEITDGILLPALEEVGEKFIRKQYFLPQVLMSAETMQKGFLYLQSLTPASSGQTRGTLLLATVKNDIHDIGKNIVKTVFENYSWKVIDLGKNVPAETIIKEAKKHNPDIIGLSALMTTTMVYMEDVVKLKIIEQLPSRIIIGGAAVTQKFADAINADGYAADAVQAVRLADQLMRNKQPHHSSE